MKQELKHHFGSRFVYETALNAKEAFSVIESLNEEGIEVVIIISDWLMPGMKGDEFLIIVRERFPSIAAVMVTGQADETAIERALETAHIRACIRKPWSSRELISIIESILEETPV